MQSITPWSIYQGQNQTKQKRRQKESLPINDMKVKFSESHKKKALIFNDPAEKSQTFYAYSATKNVNEPLELLCTLKILKAYLQISQEPCLYLPKVRLSPAIKKPAPKPHQYNKIKHISLKKQEKQVSKIRMKGDIKKSQIFQYLPFNDEKMIRYSKGKSEQFIQRFLKLESSINLDMIKN